MGELKQSDEGKKYFKELKITQRRRIMCGAKIKYLKDLPKKPKGAVVLFMSKTVGQIKKDQPHLKGFEIQKVLKERWVSLGTEGQKEFNDEARQLQQQFDDEMAQFKKSDNWKGFVRATTPKGKLKIKKVGKMKGSPGPRPPTS